MIERKTLQAGALVVTPVQRIDHVWVKRDDLYHVAGVNGGKAHACWALSQGAPGLVSGGSRVSPQIVIVASVAKALGVPCEVHSARGKTLLPNQERAVALGAQLVQHRAGYLNVVEYRAKARAAALGWRFIPFGMADAAVVGLTARQVVNVPEEARRIVVPVGSGLSLAGVLIGLQFIGRVVPVLGVVVGRDPARVLNKFAPQSWGSVVKLVCAEGAYNVPVAGVLGSVALAVLYEAKCLPFLQSGDLLWVVGADI